MKITSAARHIWRKQGHVLFVFMILISYVSYILARHNGNPLAFVRVGIVYNAPLAIHAADIYGYDGQFAYHIALYPLTAAPYLDVPAYRYQRILYPLTARLFSLGQATALPWVLIGLNIAALTYSTYLMGLMLAQYHYNRWYAVLAALFVGQLTSLRLDLTEPFSLMFALLAIYTFEQQKPRQAALSLAASLLSKETALAFVGGYLFYYLLQRQWRLLVETALISLTPLAILQFILWLNFGTIGLRSGGMGTTGFSWLPFGSILAFDLTTPATLFTVIIVLAPLILIPSLGLSLILLRNFSQGQISPLAFIVLLHLIMMATLPFSTYVDLPAITRLASGLIIATLAFATLTQNSRLLRLTPLWFSSTFLLIFIG